MPPLARVLPKPRESNCYSPKPEAEASLTESKRIRNRKAANLRSIDKSEHSYE